ncbi:MAG: FixH family protein, partial [Limisphaerales bacterium]
LPVNFTILTYGGPRFSNLTTRDVNFSFPAGADYYEAEIKFQQQIDRVERSRPTEAQLGLNYDAQTAKIVVQLPRDSQTGASGKIELYRPSDARQDKNIKLAADQNGTQRIDVRGLKSGLWKVRVNWTYAGQEYFVEKPITISNS